MAKKNAVTDRITTLEARELTLFHSYNRHHNAAKKIEVLNELVIVISKLEELKQLN